MISFHVGLQLLMEIRVSLNALGVTDRDTCSIPCKKDADKLAGIVFEGPNRRLSQSRNTSWDWGGIKRHSITASGGRLIPPMPGGRNGNCAAR